MPRKYYAKYTRELLTEAAVNSISIADVLRYLEIPVTGGAHAHISRKIKQLGIDTSHFLGQAHMRNQPSMRPLAPESFWLHASRAHDVPSRACCAGHCARVVCGTHARRVASRPSGTASR